MGFIGKQIKFVLVVIIVIFLFGIAYRMEPRLGLVDIEYEITVSGEMVYAGQSSAFEMKSGWDYKPEIAADGKTTIIKLSDETQVSKSQFKQREMTFMVKDAKTLVKGTKLQLGNLICDISPGAAFYKETLTTYTEDGETKDMFYSDLAEGWLIIDDAEKMQGTFEIAFTDVDEKGNKTVKIENGKLDVVSRRIK